MNFETWPRQGRVGIAEAGPYSGAYVFVFRDSGQFWGWYTSLGDDDILDGTVMLEERLLAAKINWLPDDLDKSVEKAVFKMRPLTSQFTPDPTLLDRLRSYFKR